MNGNFRDGLNSDFSDDAFTILAVRTKGLGGAVASNFSRDGGNGNVGKVIWPNCWFTMRNSRLRIFAGSKDIWLTSGERTPVCPVLTRKSTPPVRSRPTAQTKIFWGGTDGGGNPAAWDNVIDTGEVYVGCASLPRGNSRFFSFAHLGRKCIPASNLLDGNLPADGFRSTWTAWYKTDPQLTFNLGKEGS